MAQETSERLKGLVKAADECGKLRAELEGQNKAHGATVTEIRDKINTVKTEAKAALDTVEKDFNEKISSCAGSLESAKTELTKKMDAKVDALEEKIQGLKKGAEDLEEDHTEEDHTEGPWVESLSLKEQQKCVYQGKITWGAAVREYPDKIVVWLLKRRIGTITKQDLKNGSEALQGIGVTGGLNHDTAGILWSKLNPGDDNL